MTVQGDGTENRHAKSRRFSHFCLTAAPQNRTRDAADFVGLSMNGTR